MAAIGRPATVTPVKAPAWPAPPEARRVDSPFPAGLMAHLAGPQGDAGWRVVDVWESREAFERFAEERLRPAVKEVGIPGMPEPEFYPIQGVWVAEWELSRSWVND